MKLHDTQKRVAEDSHDYRVVDCGRQWGKTTLAVLEMVACGYAKSGREIAYFATTYDQARNIAWAMLKDYSHSVWAKSPNESRLELIIKTQEGGNKTSRLTLRGFENVETARGQQFDFLVLDEVAQMKNWEYNWQAVLEPTLAFRQGKALFISTPKGFNHFHEMFVRGQDETNEYWKSWRFTSYDNPYLPRERIEQAKATSTEEYFAQEYMADFRKYTGVVYKAFDRETHVVNDFDVPSDWQIYRAFDFGSNNPTVCLWIAVDKDDNWWIVDEHYVEAQTIDYHAGRVNSHKLSNNVIATYGDPSGKQWIDEFALRSVYITPATKQTNTSQQNWTRYGIEMLQTRLKSTPGHFVAQRNADNQPKLFVFNTCVNTIREFESYRWKERIIKSADDLNKPDMPEKASDHAMDALRYFAVSYTAQPAEDAEPEQWKEFAWRIGK